MQKKKVLVLYAHPSQHRSEVNQPLFEAARQISEVTAVDLYAEYPTLNINIEREQNRLIEHDVIIFQFPLFWYSTPAILKEWQDLVLEYGFAYGHTATALKGKTFLCALSAGGKEDAYQAEGFNHFTINELLRPMEQMANITGMNYLPPFALFGSRTAAEEGRIEEHVAQWVRFLYALVGDEIDLNAARKVDKLNRHLDTIITGDEA
ncbi:NAD(P)H-dependent oxidoreductase [Vibrio sp. JC009]|uniref:NAD(P)H-dependent oxidoreductase n=1 Tax=Vibrio sp. JC009 TaxID=2912314 RepID=UPI0023B10FAA|nr:NAD(P)H-dependent oxidoreductase [Vibrio sp. JC009]WED23579.1 NAD(P)H-dependent oxidoreductase [Vibrio sp. JC009]